MPNFISVAAPIAQLARGEKSHTQSLTHSITHSATLFDVPETEAFTSDYKQQISCTLTHTITIQTGLCKIHFN